MLCWSSIWFKFVSHADLIRKHNSWLCILFSEVVRWAGDTTFSTGASTCIACPPGKFSGLPGAATCTLASFPYNQPPINFSVHLCGTNKTWPEILDMKDKKQAWVGGLGKLATSYSRVWLCLNSTFSHPACPKYPDLACYVFLIQSSKFAYYGPNLYLCLVSGCSRGKWSKCWKR